MHQSGSPSPTNLFFRHLEHFTCGGIRGKNGSIRRGEQDGVHTILFDETVALFTFPQGFFRLLALADVAHNADNGGALPRFSSDFRDGDLGEEGTAILAPHRIFRVENTVRVQRGKEPTSKLGEPFAIQVQELR